MIALLDTDVLVDCLRGTKAAQAWLMQTPTARFQVPGIVAMELVTGSRNQIDLQRVERFLSAFDLVWPDPNEFSWAYDLLRTYYLGSSIGIPDCLIAAMTLSRSATLYTFNFKHFSNIPDLNVQAPYVRI